MTNIQLPKLTCNRCGHTWIPRKPELPKWCPNCTSPYWNKPRVRNVTPATHMVSKETKIAQLQHEIDLLKKQLAKTKRKSKTDGGKSK